MPAGLPAVAEEREAVIELPTSTDITEPKLNPTPLNDEFVAPDSAAGKGQPASNPPEAAWMEPDLAASRTAASGTKGGTANRAPSGTVVGAPGLGALPYFSFDQTPLTTDTVARTNLGNGNLLLTSNDGVLNGPSLTVRNDRYYNGLSTSVGSFGAGWSSPLSAVDVGLAISGYNATFTGPTGFQAVFTLVGSTWTPPAGFNARLETIGGYQVITYNQTGEKVQFNSSGWIMSDKNRNGVGTTYTYGTGNKVSQVTEASGRYYTIAWTTAGYIDTITDSSGRITDYTQNGSGQLTRVVSPGAYFEDYFYDSSGRLSEINYEGDCCRFG